MESGKGQLKFTYKYCRYIYLASSLSLCFSFQSALRTTGLAIRVLKVVPHRDSQEDSVVLHFFMISTLNFVLQECSLVCRAYLSLRDFRMLQTFNNSFAGRLRSLLVEVASSKEFTNQRGKYLIRMNSLLGSCLCFV